MNSFEAFIEDVGGVDPRGYPRVGAHCGTVAVDDRQDQRSRQDGRRKSVGSDKDSPIAEQVRPSSKRNFCTVLGSAMGLLTKAATA